MVLQYRRLKPSLKLAQYLKSRRIKPGAKVKVILDGLVFQATYELLKIRGREHE